MSKRPDAAPGAWSLRRRLLILTAVVTALAWLAGGGAMFVIAHNDSEALFDQRLRDIAVAVLTFADHEIDEIRAKGSDIVHMETARTLGTRYRYQIWSPDGTLLLVSFDAPRSAFAPPSQQGFETREIDGVAMRTLVLWADDGTKLVEVAEPLSARPAFVGPALGYLLALFLLSLAALVAMNAWLIRRATRALSDSARQLTERSPNDLRPLDVAAPPSELLPMIGEINALFGRFEDALETERRFTTAAAHELRTPLAAVKVQAQVALLTRAAGERRSALERLMLSIDRAAHMVDQLLTLTRIDGMIALRARTQPLRLDIVTGHVIDEMQPLLARRDQHVSAQLEPCQIEGLEFGIAVLIRNLIDNAARYGPAGGPIRVRTGVDGADGCFAIVEDAGPGIPPDQRQRVFERFYRLPDSSADGCGIGLSIVQTVAEVHRALIDFDSSDLGGLRVRVRFPYRVDHPSVIPYREARDPVGKMSIS
jgi:signal transduction histidine kinase